MAEAHMASATARAARAVSSPRPVVPSGLAWCRGEMGRVDAHRANASGYHLGGNEGSVVFERLAPLWSRSHSDACGREGAKSLEERHLYGLTSAFDVTCRESGEAKSHAGACSHCVNESASTRGGLCAASRPCVPYPPPSCFASLG